MTTYKTYTHKGYTYKVSSDIPQQAQKLVHAIGRGMLDTALVELAVAIVRRSEHCGPEIGVRVSNEVLQAVSAFEQAGVEGEAFTASVGSPTPRKIRVPKGAAMPHAITPGRSAPKSDEVHLRTGDTIKRSDFKGKVAVVDGVEHTIIGVGEKSFKVATDPDNKETHRFVSVFAAKKAGWF